MMATVTPHATAPRRVLLVDGDADSRVIYGAILQHRGFTATTLADADEGAASLITGEYDVVVVDAGSCEPRTAKALRDRARVRGVPVLALTTRVTERELSALRGAGYTYILPKPFPPVALADAVAALGVPAGV